MKKPGTFIEFVAAIRKATSTVDEGGVVAVLVKDTNLTSPVRLSNASQMPEKLTDANKEEIMRVFQSAVDEVILLPDTLTAAKYTFDVVCACSSFGENEISTGTAVQGVIVDKKRAGHKVFGVITGEASITGNEDLCAIGNGSFKIGGKTVEAAKYTGRIAGIIAAKGITGSLTYEELPEIEYTEPMDDAAIENSQNIGQMVIIEDEGRYVISRGITTLIDENSQFCKIRAVMQRNFIHNTLRSRGKVKIGKIEADYDGKLELISDFRNLLDELVNRKTIDADYVCELDVEAIAKHLGEDAIGLSDQQLKQANTGDKVYVLISVKLIDVMEEIYIKINL